jgi:hypothetical protein
MNGFALTPAGAFSYERFVRLLSFRDKKEGVLEKLVERSFFWRDGWKNLATNPQNKSQVFLNHSAAKIFQPSPFPKKQ